MSTDLPDEFRRLIGLPIEDLPTPAVLIDVQTMQRNIDAMGAHARALRVALRPHWKTSKVAQVAMKQIAAGAVGLTAATASEVAALVVAGVNDVFWAYPPVGSPRVRAALHAHAATHLIIGVDSPECTAELAAAATASRTVVDVRLELDTGLGRTGVKLDDVVAAARALDVMEGIRIEGIFTHEGHVQAVGGGAEKRHTTGVAAGRAMVEAAEAIRSDGIPLASVSVGSTAGATSTPTVAGVTEVRPGTYVYGDENQVSVGTMRPQDTAMTLLSRVISVQRGEPVLVDAGTKAMSSDGSMHGDGRIGTIVSGAGGILGSGNEEHGYLRGSAGLKVGDLIRVRPNHACALSNMHSHVLAVENDVVVDVWPVLGRH